MTEEQAAKEYFKDINIDWKAECAKLKTELAIARELREITDSGHKAYVRELNRAEKAEAERDQAIERAANYEMDRHKAETERDKLKAQVAQLRRDLENVLGIFHDHNEEINTNDSEDTCIRVAWNNFEIPASAPPQPSQEGK